MILRAAIILEVIIFLGLSVECIAQKVIIPEPDSEIRVYPLYALNSPFTESSLAITPDGEYLFFSTNRGGQIWNEPYQTPEGDSLYDKDIWVSENVCGKWQKPYSLPHGINTALSEDEPFISADGKILYFQSWNYLWEQTGGPYYQTKLIPPENPSLRGMGKKLTRVLEIFSGTGSFALSPEKKLILLVAGKPEEHQMDIFFIRKNGKSWKYPEKSALSTPQNERSAFLMADGQTVYFASAGYEGFGGLDIYKTTLDDYGNPGVIFNLGPEINGPEDEYSFVIAPGGEEGYFIREGNIYCADLSKTENILKP
ncbi:MAG: hypothetical protein SF052_04360 [Bacteroidia bacterium]|nr:hypothetical protein [Bacteroidia bacterium]